MTNTEISSALRNLEDKAKSLIDDLRRVKIKGKETEAENYARRALKEAESLKDDIASLKRKVGS